MSHNLNSPWTFYYFEKANPQNPDDTYDKCIHKIAKVYTAEEFWHYYSHINKPDQLEPRFSLHFFRNDSRAMWEDPENQNGGAFFYKVNDKSQTKYLWERLLLNLIGEQLNEDIIGVVVTPRPKLDFIYIWHKTAESEEIRLEICRQLQNLFELPLQFTIGYNIFNQKNHEQRLNYIITKTGPVLQTANNEPKQPKKQ
ncbi:hypothetical protein M9Y10_008239 [Tritrichomonas musculus]|uniref:Uncharacterized protein n=1 Tax=Tritrichomonas musculus TaxID=1915356 RepID=A0ABR2IXM6_9EUKA